MKRMRKYNTFFISTGLSLFALIVALTMKTPHFYLCFAAMFICTIGDIILANFYGFKIKFLKMGILEIMELEFLNRFFGKCSILHWKGAKKYV